MTKNSISVQYYFTLDSHETTQKQPEITKSTGAVTKSTRSKAKACDKAKRVQSEVRTELATPGCNEQRSRKPQYLGPVRLTRSVVGSIVWWARDGGGEAPEGFMQVFQGNGYPSPQLRHPNSKEALENSHLLNTKTRDRIAAVFVDKDGQSDPVWIDLKREVLIQCD